MQTPASHSTPNCGASVAELLEAHLKSAVFPCFGARTALARGQLVVVEAGDIETDSHKADVLRAVYDYVRGYKEAPKQYQSLVIAFPQSRHLDEAEFERALWDRLQSWHEADSLSHAWDPRVSSDPQSPAFSFSLGGEAFYVVGMHPSASRPARRFAVPALVLNLHQQFETLRASGKYQAFRDGIRERDRQVNGSSNPMLSDFGKVSEARQYSGRRVDEQWRCPFKGSSH